MQKVTQKEARKRYMRAFRPIVAIYVVVILGGSFLLAQYETKPLWLSVTVALISGLAVAFILVAMMRYFEEADEYVRLQQLRAFGWGAVCTLSVSFIIAFLQMFDVLDDIEVFWLPISFFLFYAVSAKIIGVKDC